MAMNYETYIQLASCRRSWSAAQHKYSSWNSWY